MIVRQQRIVIVGGGIVGLSTAYALLTAGVKQVTVLEQEAVNHCRASSHGISRLLRFEYGSDLFYSNMVRLSLNRWQQLEHLSRRTLYTPTGLLILGSEHDSFTRSSYYIMHELHMSSERLSKQHCQQRFPQFASHSHDFITYNTEAGILHASTCLHTLRDMIYDLGGTIYQSCRVTHIGSNGPSHPIRLHTSTGTELLADRVVLATGAWVHRLLTDLAAQRIPVTLFLVQNGVLAARQGARAAQFTALVANPGVTVLADTFALQERGMPPEALVPGVQASDLDILVDLLMADDQKAIWH